MSALAQMCSLMIKRYAKFVFLAQFFSYERVDRLSQSIISSGKELGSDKNLCVAWPIGAAEPLLQRQKLMQM